MVPDIYMPMLQTAETVAKRYGIPRDRQDAYGLRSQRLTAEAQAEGVFDQEIVPVTATMTVVDKATGETSRRSEEHTSELQSLMRISYAVFCLHKKITYQQISLGES